MTFDQRTIGTPPRYVVGLSQEHRWKTDHLRVVAMGLPTAHLGVRMHSGRETALFVVQ